MPFIRHTRDKRGYETTFVMHAYRPLQGPQKTRILYLFRSPAHLKIGRRPLDDESREALEHTHPDVSFDWTVLGRESAMVRVEAPPPRGRPNRPPRPQPVSAPPAPPPAREDESLLGKVLGASAAARLRGRYAELGDRVARRSRTPEERDRLTERLRRLNPDDWADEAAIRAAAETVEAEWDAVSAELPSRRRGRRGGRRRNDDTGGPAGSLPVRTPPESPQDRSGIIDDGEETEDAGVEERWMDQPDRAAGPGGDDGADRTEPAAGRDSLPGDD